MTFVKSTQLDANWTWQQLRQMQLGGNANAVSKNDKKPSSTNPILNSFCNFQISFFRHHNCDTSDTQLKYKSRAAQLYRDKLHSEAAKAMRIHGTKLFIDAPQSVDEGDDKPDEAEEADFFDQHTDESEVEASRSVPAKKNSPILGAVCCFFVFFNVTVFTIFYARVHELLT